MKRLTAWVLALVMVATSTNVSLANDQDPMEDFNVDNVSFVLSTDYFTGNDVVNPTVDLSWTFPDLWNLEGEYHEPDKLQLDVDNLTSSSADADDELTFDTDVTSIELHNETQLDSGTLYRLSLFPYHTHYEYNDDGSIRNTSVQNGESLVRYVVTELATEYVTSSNEIQVIWDDLGDSRFKYRISYALGEFDSKDDLLNNSEGTFIKSSTSEGVESFADGRDKLSFVIDQNIIAGQSYSVMVEPIFDDYEQQNRVRIESNVAETNITNVATAVELFVEEEGPDLRLSWQIPESYLIDGNTSTLQEVKILQYKNGVPQTIAIFEQLAGAIGYYKLTKPTTETGYQLEITYSNQSSSTFSNVVTYSPTDYLIQPTMPEIPDLLTDPILEDIIADVAAADNAATETELQLVPYLVEGYKFDGNLPDIMNDDVTFHVEEEGGINFVWGAFNRLDVDEEGDLGEPIYDNNVYYDIYVTDTYSALAGMEPVYTDIIHTSTLDAGSIVMGDEDDEDGQEIVGYRHTLETYYKAATELTSAELTEITPGKLYYISIRARKVTGRGTLTSDRNTVAVYYDYDGSAFQPPSLAKPPLEVKGDETTEDGITLRWKESWYEIIAEEATAPHILSEWQHQLWIYENEDGEKVVTDDPVEDLEPYRIYLKEYYGVDEIERFKDDYAEIEPGHTILEREVSLYDERYGSDVDYKFKYIRYDQVLSTMEANGYTYDEYIDVLMAKGDYGNLTGSWEDIEPYEDDGYLAYRQEGLRENAAYLFVLLPYRTLQDGRILTSHYPSTIVVATEPEGIVVTPKPTVPNLYADAISDGEIAVEWKYNSDFTYELVYSLEDDISTAVAVQYELPEEDDDTYPDDGAYYAVTVDDLFPLTTYYFWLRATAADGTGEPSSWSNPVYEMTKDAPYPIPPRGLGLLPERTAESYGYDLSVSEDYMIIEWMKDPYDTETETDAKVQKTYTYIVEVSENPKFIDPVYVESTGGTADIVPSSVVVLEKNILKFGDLVGNRHYYVRAKARLVIEGSEEGQYITRDSVSYTIPIRILTLASGTEYDGEIDPALTILPRDDFELIYDSGDDILEFRFRSSGQDDDGASDNSVDQRLISDLINEKATSYEVDLTSYKSKDIDQRRVTMPYSIVEAFDDYGIDLIVLTENVNLNIPSDSLVGEVYDQVNRFGTAPTVVIDITDMSSSDVYDQLPDSGLQSIATPQEIRVNVISDRDSRQVFYADELIEVEIPVIQWYGIDAKEVTAFVEDSRGNWSPEESEYNDKAHTVTFETAKLGGIGAFVYERGETIDGVNKDQNHWSEAYRREVYSQFTVLGNEVYDPDASVSEKAVAQAIYGTIADSKIIDLEQSMTSAQVQTLIRAGITSDDAITGGTINRQTAVSMFVRAYEIIDGESIEVSENTLSTVQSVSGVDSAYAEQLAKAVEAGLLFNVTELRPADDLEFGEFFTLWSRLLD